MTLEQVAQIEAKLDYVFANKILLVRAFTHSSVVNAKRDGNALLDSNERSAFFGDSILGMIVSQYLFDTYPSSGKGDMSYMRSRLVSSDTLAPVVKSLGLVEHLRLLTDSEPSEHLCGDLYEAVVCAIYLDGGFASAQKFVLFSLRDALVSVKTTRQKDSKTILQEYCQGQRPQKTVTYVQVGRTGTDNNPTYTIDLYIDNEYMCSGQGRRIPSAEQDAAKKLVTKWRID